VARIPDVSDDKAWTDDGWVWNEGVTPDRPIVKSMADVVPEKVSWLWQGWIPFAAMSILDGDPGVGKSTVTVDIAARVSAGLRMPDGSRGFHGRVMLLGAEDDPGTTVRPRLEAAGGDVNNVVFLEGIEGERDPLGRPLWLPQDIYHLEAAIVRNQIDLVIIDPLMAYISAEVSSNNDQEVRRVLSPLKVVAHNSGAAILFVRHMRKTKEGGLQHQGGGSVGIAGACRAQMAVYLDPDDEAKERVILKMAKMNVARKPEPLAYTLDTHTRYDVSIVRWEAR
jgi:RecA-family ATPase